MRDSVSLTAYLQHMVLQIIILIFFNNALPSDRQSAYFSVSQKLNRENFVARKEYFSFQNRIDIMQNIVSAIVHEHADH